MPTAPAAPDPDGPLVARLRQGDRGAFDEIVRRHQGDLKRLVQRYVKDRAEAEDVVQAALLRAYEHIEGFRGDSAFRTWLFRIAINGALSRVRTAKAVQLDELADVATFTRSLQTSRLVAAEVWERVRARLESLPPRQRLVLELRVFHDLSFDEIAVIVGSSEDAAKVNFHHAVERLRGLLSLAPLIAPSTGTRSNPRGGPPCPSRPRTSRRRGRASSPSGRRGRGPGHRPSENNRRAWCSSRT